MKHFAMAALMTAAATAGEAAERVNPFLQPSYGTKYEIPPFDRIQYSDYLPAIRQGIKELNADIEAIVTNPAKPDFNNTILAYEKAGKHSTR